jgi:hypothetical protein
MTFGYSIVGVRCPTWYFSSGESQAGPKEYKYTLVALNFVSVVIDLEDHGFNFDLTESPVTKGARTLSTPLKKPTSSYGNFS